MLPKLSFDSLKGTFRVLVLFAPNEDDRGYQDAADLVRDAAFGLRTRRVRVLTVFENGSAKLDGEPVRLMGTSAVREQFGGIKGQLRVVLVGLNGTSRVELPAAFDPADVFTVIDEAEIKRRRKHLPASSSGSAARLAG
jgi:hypothetical protein